MDVYDSNLTQDDVFLGCATITGLALQHLLGFLKDEGGRDHNSALDGSVGGSVKSGGSGQLTAGGSVGSHGSANDDLTIATVSAADGTAISIERGTL